MKEESPYVLSEYDSGRLMTTGDVKRRVGIPTFLKAPPLDDVDNADVGIIGIPFDGSMIGCPGTRYGPRGIRNNSWRVNEYNAALRVKPFENHIIADCGDVVFSPYSIPKAHKSTKLAITNLLSRNILPVGVGGDHSVTHPILNAICQKHGPVAVVHFDSHTDTGQGSFGEQYSHGTMFRRGIEEGFIIPDKLIQVGIRKLFYEEELDFHTQHNIRIISTIELKEMGVEGFQQEVQKLKDNKVYITFDIDFVDPAFAPGTGGPEPGGPTSFEALQYVRALQGLNIVGCDLVEVSPPLDVGDITSLLAVHILYEMVSILP
jgi:agmatinase